MKRLEPILFEKYGINKLTELTKEAKTKPDPIELLEPTIQMYEKLYKDNSALTQQFMSMITEAGPIKDSGLDITLCRWINVLEVFIEVWQKGKEDLIIEEYNHRCSRVIP